MEVAEYRNMFPTSSPMPDAPIYTHAVHESLSVKVLIDWNLQTIPFKAVIRKLFFVSHLPPPPQPNCIRRSYKQADASSSQALFRFPVDDWGGDSSSILPTGSTHRTSVLLWFNVVFIIVFLWFALFCFLISGVTFFSPKSIPFISLGLCFYTLLYFCQIFVLCCLILSLTLLSGGV